MTSETPVKQVRDGNAAKRAAILAAARELFLRDGVERTSMDGVATRAAVSKRTVYDYFGDKRSLLLAVIEQAADSLVLFLREADARNLADTTRITTSDELERALAGFAKELGRTIIAAPDYIVVDRLIRENAAILPELVDHPLLTAPEGLLTERIAHFAEAGLLDASDPALAADHFKALTIYLAINDASPQPHGGGLPERERIDRIMADGAHAFIRAYGHRA